MYKAGILSITDNIDRYLITDDIDILRFKEAQFFRLKEDFTPLMGLIRNHVFYWYELGNNINYVTTHTKEPVIRKQFDKKTKQWWFVGIPGTLK